jgi:capsular exopolysaccharide synthesis family protein
LDIKEYFRIFRRWWPVILVLTIVGVALGYATGFSLINRYLPTKFSNEYASTATLFVATQSGTSVTEAYQNNLFSQQRVVSYAGLATSEQVAARAVDQLKAPISAAALRAKVSANAAENTVLLDVSVQDPDAAQAQTYANAVVDQLVNVVSELETSRRGGTPAAGLVVVDEANFPTEPLGFAMWKRLALGAACGLLVGIIAAVLIGIADKRLRGREAVEELSGSLVLGALPEDRSRAKVDVVDLAADSVYGERIRELRTNLRFADASSADGPPRCIAVTSPSPQEGRTTTAIDLAAALAESGRTVVLVDGDLRQPAIADRLHLEPAMRDGAAARGLSTVLVGEHNLVEALISGVSVGEHVVSLLPAGPSSPRPGELWATDRAGALFDQLADGFDYVIVDTPPLGIYNDGAIIGALCDGAVVVARIRSTTTPLLRRALLTLQSANARLIGTVVTFERVGAVQRRRHRQQVQHDTDVRNSAARAVKVKPAVDGRRAEHTEEIADAGEDRLVGSAVTRRTSKTRRGSE